MTCEINDIKCLNTDFVYTFYIFFSHLGPPKIPFFGSYLFLLLLNKDHLHYAVIKLCTFYKTNILGFYLGTTPLVVMNSGEKVKQSLLHREFDGKPDLVVARLREPNMNLFGKYIRKKNSLFISKIYLTLFFRNFLH